MPKIVATFKVVDVDRWLGLKEENAAIVAPFATDVATFVALDGSNSVGMSMDVHDMAGMQAGLASPSPEMLATEKNLGVIRPIDPGLHGEVANPTGAGRRRRHRASRTGHREGETAWLGAIVGPVW